MNKLGKSASAKEHSIIVLLLALLILLPPLLGLWSHEDSHWFSPYLVWCGLIAAAYFLQRYLRQEADAQEVDK